MMMVMMMVVPGITIARPDNDPGAVVPIIAVMVMVMMMMMLDEELGHLYSWRALGFINSPQLFRSIRYRFEEVRVRACL